VSLEPDLYNTLDLGGLFPLEGEHVTPMRARHDVRPYIKLLDVCLDVIVLDGLFVFESRVEPTA
jgi:hypothetical protein